MDDLRGRTKRLALNVIRFVGQLPGSMEGRIIGRQVLRSATSVGAHYRECRHSRSRAEFRSKLGLALQELEETLYWLELLKESKVSAGPGLEALMYECDELIAILIACIKTTKQSGKA
ncbi:four helix bundle protein [Thioalkalivibrio sulfidiphilus]|uniref:four helix bundle protein n=1 Tax=Thioalkalivibrio sulfidiphilus TaxID=1033854 RepID=UPI000378C8C0|nr:four helix bundle protein [Thioalkalivibrio sulfidiphilus]